MTAGAGRRHPRAAIAWIGFLVLGLSAVVAAVLTGATAGPDLSTLGLPDAGAATRSVMSACQAFANCGAVVTVGLLLVAAIMIRPDADGRLGAVAARTVRRAAWTAAGWAASALAMVPLTVADALGRPVGQVVASAVLRDFPRLPGSLAWACTAVVAGAVGLGCRAARSWGAAALSLLGAVVALAPVAVTGHAGTGRQHELATDSMVLHVLAASIWVGGLLAVLLHVADDPAGSAPLVRRFSTFALICWLTIAATGLVNAAVRCTLRDLSTTTYGVLVLAKVAALGALGCLGAGQRTRSIAALHRGDRGGLVRLGAVELIVMAATIGLSVTLSRTAPPPAAGSTALPRLPGFASLLTDWNLSLILGGTAIAAAIGYATAARKLAPEGWSSACTRSWMAGCATVLVVTCSGIGTYATMTPWLHLVQHIVLSTVAPLLLMAGRPLLMTMRFSGGSDGPPSLSEFVRWSLDTRLVRLLAHPAVGFVLIAVPSFWLHRSGYFDRGGVAHWQHLASSVYFLVAGMLFFWPVLGRDPAPRSFSPGPRVGALAGIVVVHLASSVRPSNGSLIAFTSASGHLVHAAVLGSLLVGFCLLLRRPAAGAAAAPAGGSAAAAGESAAAAAGSHPPAGPLSPEAGVPV